MRKGPLPKVILFSISGGRELWLVLEFPTVILFLLQTSPMISMGISCCASVKMEFDSIGSVSRCMPGTRQEVIGKIIAWIDGGNRPIGLCAGYTGQLGQESRRYQGRSLNCAPDMIGTVAASFSCSRQDVEVPSLTSY